MSDNCDEHIIDRYRGNTNPILRYVWSRATRSNKDLTLWNFKLTVNTEEFPGDDTNQQFQLTGVLIDSDAEVVGFQPSEVQADWIGTRYYDIQMIDENMDVITREKGVWIQRENITKS